MMAAGTAAEAGARVTLLEGQKRLGRKLRITGKGRCNVTNACAVRDFLANVPRNPKFLFSAVTAFPPERTMAFFEDLGVPLKTERGNRVFPVSDNANDVADALEAWNERKALINWSNVLVTMHTASPAVLERFNCLPYPGR